MSATRIVQGDVAGFPGDTSLVLCRALRIAQCALQLQIAWHAGAIKADAAMATMEYEITEALERFALPE